MRLRQFLFVVDREPTEMQVEALFDRRDDAVVELEPASGVAWVAFDREAPALVDAVVSGIRDLDSVGVVPRQVRDDDDVVTLGLIAQRIGRPQDAVRRWAMGLTGPGGFPAPVVEHPRRPCYLWSEVAPWLGRHHGHEPHDASMTLQAVNLALELRALGPDVERMAAIRGLLAG